MKANESVDKEKLSDYDMRLQQFGLTEYKYLENTSDDKFNTLLKAIGEKETKFIEYPLDCLNLAELCELKTLAGVCLFNKLYKSTEYAGVHHSETIAQTYLGAAQSTKRLNEFFMHHLDEQMNAIEPDPLDGAFKTDFRYLIDSLNNLAKTSAQKESIRESLDVLENLRKQAP